MTYPVERNAKPVHNLDWRHPIRLIALGIKIFFLRIVTFGIYHFWGKTEVRRRLWSAVHLEGQPLEYTGTGKELFLGFIIVFFLVLLPLLLAFQGLALLPMVIPDRETAAIIMGVGYITLFTLIYFLTGVAQYRARRYRLSRSRWRGIRGAMAGSPMRFGWTHLWTLLLLPLSFGWATPWRSIKLQRKLTNDSRFGDEPLRFEGSSRSLYGPFALLWFSGLLIFPAIGIINYLLFGDQIAQEAAGLQIDPKLKAIMSAKMLGIFAVGFLLLALAGVWYKSREMNYIARATQIDNANFRLATSPMSLIWLVVGNALIFILVMLITAVLFGAVMGGIAFLQVPPELPASSMWLLQFSPYMPVVFALAVLSAGIAEPLVAARTARYFVTRFGIDGSIDFNRIAQSQEKLGSTGEGLAEAFDIDGF